MGLCMSIDEKNEKKRLAMEVLSAEAKAAQLLSQMPGRLCTNGATKSCSLHTRQGCKGINQDSMLAWEGFAAEDESVFCGVFDGHGPNGHLVASKVRDCLPSLLTLPLDSLLEDSNTPHHHICEPIKNININQADKEQPGDSNKSEDDEEEDEDSYWIEERFTTAFHKMDERLKTHPKLSCMSSGTTAVAMLVQGKDLVVGSVGDSRGILVSRDEDGAFVAHQLTIDLKPDSPGELERIQECQGRVFALEDEPHIARLWLPHANTPGLAMSRAFGDFCLKEHGLIATPRISHRKLTEDDEFIVLATDGVWDVLSNKSVMDTVVSSGSKEEAAKCVVDAAINTWKQRNLATRIDDCAVVCHFLKDKLSPSLAPKISKKLKGREYNQDNAKQGKEALETNAHLIRYDTIVAIDKQETDLVPSLQLERVV